MSGFKALIGDSESSSSMSGAATSKAFGIDSNVCPSLALSTRIKVFCVLFAIGIVISLLSTISLASLNIVTFGVMYSIGNLVSLSSTTILFGPWKQIKNMFARKRILATFMYLGCLGGTLGVAIGTGSVMGTIAMIVLQFISLVWYTLSYVPYGRDIAAKAITGCCK